MNLAWAKRKIASMASAMRGTSMKLTDNAAKGYLSIYKEYSDGTKEDVIVDDPNIIMFAARRHHLAFLHDSNTGSDLLNSFKVGSGGATGSDTGGNTNVRVIAPDPARDDLYAPINLVNQEIEVNPSDPIALPKEVYLQILFTLSQDEANGLFINECGLFKESGDIFNHKTFASIAKNESFSLIFDWKIKYI